MFSRSRTSRFPFDLNCSSTALIIIAFVLLRPFRPRQVRIPRDATAIVWQQEEFEEDYRPAIELCLKEI